MTTTTTIFGANIVETSKEEFVAFLTDRKVGITVDTIKAELSSLGAEFSKKAIKAELAGLLFDELKAAGEDMEDMDFAAEMDADFGPQAETAEVDGVVGNLSAASETPIEMCVECGEVPAVAYDLCKTCRAKVDKPASEFTEAVVTVIDESAAGETLVAEENIKEEDNMNSSQEVEMELQRIQNEKNLKALQNSRVLKNQVILKGSEETYVNKVSQLLEAQLQAAVNSFYSRVGQFPIQVLQVIPVEGDRFNRIGFVDVQLPKGYAMVKIRNSEEKTWEWYDFCDFNYNQMVKRYKWEGPFPAAGMVRGLEMGSGIIRLAIREDANKEVYVRLPMDKDDYKENVFYDVFRTSDVRWDRPNSSNNAILEARITASTRFFWKELKRKNPMNRSGFAESCMSCANMQWFGTRDGVDDDLHLPVRPENQDEADALLTNLKSTRIFNQQDIETLAQHGELITQGWCTAKKLFVDAEAVSVGNKLRQDERRYYEVEVVDPITEEVRIEHRFQGRDEVILAGKPVKVRNLREELTRNTCAGCQFYRKNQYKGENVIGNEKVEAREKLLSVAKNDTERDAIKGTNAYKRPFTQSYWTGRPEAGSEAFETLVSMDGKTSQWVPGYPADVALDAKGNQLYEVLNVRVGGQSGVYVYFSDSMIQSMTQADFLFNPATESYNEAEAKFNKVVNMIFYAAFNRDKMSKDKFQYVIEVIYVQGKPEGITAKQSERWDNAVHWFEQSLEWATQREAARNRPDFMTKFYSGIDGYVAAKGLTETPDLQKLGVQEIHIEDVLFETIFRVVEGGLLQGYENMFESFNLERGYEDLEPKDFIRFLDDVAQDYILDALSTGCEYVIVGGKNIDMDDEEKFAIEYFGEKDRYAKTVEDILSDAGLVSDTLQLMLQRQINALLYGVNRAADKVDAFSALNVCEDVLWYIAEHAGLLKKEEK